MDHLLPLLNNVGPSLAPRSTLGLRHCLPLFHSLSVTLMPLAYAKQLHSGRSTKTTNTNLTKLVETKHGNSRQPERIHIKVSPQVIRKFLKSLISPLTKKKKMASSWDYSKFKLDVMCA